METNIDISGAFKVGSWLVSIDNRDREQFLKSSQDWTAEHTDLLLRELEALTSGDSLLDVNLVRTSKKSLLYALVKLNEFKDVPFAHIAVGLTLIP